MLTNFVNEFIYAKNIDTLLVKNRLEENYYGKIIYMKIYIDDNSSEEEENIIKKNQIQRKVNRASTKVILTKLRSLPTILLFIFLIIFSLISFNHLVGFYKVKKIEIYKEKFNISYFSESFYKQHDFIKVKSYL